jgi:hypothetical protein
MRLMVVAALLGLIATLNVGYYNEVSDGEVNKVFFLKKSPTLRVQFFNIHANDGDYRKLENLTDDYRQKIIDYCKYRLGIETELKTQADVEVCAKM